VPPTLCNNSLSLNIFKQTLISCLFPTVLGVWIDANLLMHEHVSRVARSCFFHLRRLRSLRRQLGRGVLARLVSALVLSRLDYCNAILVGLPQTTLSSLQRILHAAARLVINLRPRDHVTQRCLSYTGYRSLKGSTSNYVCLSTRHLLGMYHDTLRTLSRPLLICHRDPCCVQHLMVICICHEHV